MSILYIHYSDMSAEAWEKMRLDNHWNEVELRDNRYNQVTIISSWNGHIGIIHEYTVNFGKVAEFSSSLDYILKDFIFL